MQCNPNCSPTHCAASNPSVLSCEMPAKMSDSIRPITAAGLANEVLNLNQYAAQI